MSKIANLIYLSTNMNKRDEKLAKTIDHLHLKYGKGIVSKATSILKLEQSMVD